MFTIIKYLHSPERIDLLILGEKTLKGSYWTGKICLQHFSLEWSKRRCNQQCILDSSHTALFVCLLKLNFDLIAKNVYGKSGMILLVNTDIKVFQSLMKYIFTIVILSFCIRAK